MMPGNRFVGDDDGLAPAQERQDQCAGPSDQPGTDQYVITALAEVDAQLFDHPGGHFARRHCWTSEPGSRSGGRNARAQPARAPITLVAVSSGGPSPLSITMSASA